MTVYSGRIREKDGKGRRRRGAVAAFLLCALLLFASGARAVDTTKVFCRSVIREDPERMLWKLCADPVKG